MALRLLPLLCLVLLLAGCDAQASRIAASWGDHRMAWRAYDGAIDCFNAAIELNPEYPVHYSHRGLVWMQKRDYKRALADFKEAVRRDAAGDHPFETYNVLAWLLATCPDGEFRDGRQALKLATKACELTAWENAAILDTLAAAYAESGDFANAVMWQLKAVELADSLLRDELTSRVALYRAEQPYRSRSGQVP